MTTTHTTAIQSAPVALAGTPFGPEDPRLAFAQAVALGSAVIGRVGPHQLANPTPCPDFDVRTLMDHLVGVLRRVAALGRGDDAFAPGIDAPAAGAGHLAAWLAAARDVDVAWADDGVLGRTIWLPWAEESGAATLVSYLNEVTVHTWDLATATGQRPAWDPQVLSLAFDGIRFMPGENRSAMFDGVRAGMPPAMRDFADPFADAVPVRDDAPLIDRLVAWNGRNPC